jgi:hypothetical protein
MITPINKFGKRRVGTGASNTDSLQVEKEAAKPTKPYSAQTEFAKEAVITQ